MSVALTKQPEISELFANLIKNNFLQHAYIFEGVSGTGKYEMALWVAQGLLCQNRSNEGYPCLACSACLRIQSGEHPDIVTIEPEGLSIKVSQVRAIKEEFSKGGMESRQKILIIKDMEKMTPNAANSLLKFIEEPEGEFTIMLLTTEVQQLLPTIVSRAQVIHFPVRDTNVRIEDIMNREVPKEYATLLAYLTQDTDRALEIYEDETFNETVQTVWEWFLKLQENKDQAFIYVQTNVARIGNNRDSATLILDLLILIYRDLTAVCFEQDRVLAFSKYESRLAEFKYSMDVTKLPDILATLLEGQKKLRRHVGIQGVFEQIALRV